MSNRTKLPAGIRTPLMAAYSAHEREQSSVVTHYLGRAINAPSLIGSDDRSKAHRLHWAWLHLGYRVQSFTDLSAAQALYLLDTLNGNQTKLDAELQEEFQRANIADPKAWYEAIQRERGRMRSKLAWRFPHDFAALDFHDKWQLLNVLKQR